MSMSARRSLILAAALVLAAVPCGAGAQVHQGSLEGDGVRLYYRAVGEGKDTVVVLHGGPARSGSMMSLRPLAEGRVLIFYDQRGGGRSDLVHDASRLGWQDHVRDLDALRRHFGIDRLTLLGSSWGSGLATLYASTYPDRVERMILFPMRLERSPAVPPDWSPPPSRIDSAGRERMAELERSWHDAPDPQATCGEYWGIILKDMVRDTAQLAGEVADVCDEPAAALRVTWDAWNATYQSLGDFEWRPRLRTITAPVLLMKGTNSTMAPEWVEAWAESLPNSQLLWIDNAAYAMWLDRPEVFFPAVSRFLDGQWPVNAEPRLPD